MLTWNRGGGFAGSPAPSIAEMVGLTRQAITVKIDNLAKNGQLSEIGQTFTPLLYNIWNLQTVQIPGRLYLVPVLSW